MLWLGNIRTNGRSVLHAFSCPLLLLQSAALTFFFSVNSLNAQVSRPIQIGGGIQFASNISRTHIESFAGDFLCGIFQNGAAQGFSFFGTAEFPLPVDNFSFIPQLGYHDLSSAFVTTPFNNEFARDVASSNIFQVYRERNFTTNMKSVSFDALLGWNPFDHFRFSAGASVAFLVKHSFEQTEKLLTSGAVYTENLLSSRSVSGGSFETNTVAASLELATGYNIPISPKASLSPELRASLPLSPIS
ncbi:MAG: hypothetical protein ABI778_08710, partial [Ignavibacteriota bacterium]